MDGTADKYLKRLRGLFITYAILYYLFLFTFGLMFFMMDVTSMLYEFVIIALIPLVYIFLGIIIKKRAKWVWVFAIIISILTALNIPIGTVFGVLFLMNLFRPEVQSYFSKSG